MSASVAVLIALLMSAPIAAAQYGDAPVEPAPAPADPAPVPDPAPDDPEPVPGPGGATDPATGGSIGDDPATGGSSGSDDASAGTDDGSGSPVRVAINFAPAFAQGDANADGVGAGSAGQGAAVDTDAPTALAYTGVETADFAVIGLALLGSGVVARRYSRRLENKA